MTKEANTGFTPIIDCPGQPFFLAKDNNETVYIFSLNKHISAPYSMAIAMGLLFGFSIRENKMVIVDVPVPKKLMAWLKSPSVTTLIESMA